MCRAWTGLLLLLRMAALLKADEGDDLLLQRIRQYWVCADYLKETPYQIEGETKCPASFDGWLCWPPLDTGQEHQLHCPRRDDDEVNIPVKASVARRFCHENGTWEGTTILHYSEEQPRSLPNPCAEGGVEEDQSTESSQEVSEREDRFWRVMASTRYLWPSPYGQHWTAQNFEECVVSLLSRPGYPPADPGGSIWGVQRYCPRTFDGWSCWNDTKAGDIAFHSCPKFIHGFDPHRHSHKVCTEDGTWFRHPSNNKSWSNYTTCIDQEDLLLRHKINTLYLAGYSLSLTALVLSLVIFFTFNSLKCGRVTIHKNLFVSFAINNILWIVWYTTVVPEPAVAMENQMPCQVLHVFLHYFLVSSYFWMFCEGFYLHTLLVLTFVAEVRVMRAIYLIGWGVPLVLVIAYAAVRMRAPEQDATYYCWMETHWSTYILVVPVCFSLLLNLGFLINIVRVLVTKLRAVNSPDSHRTRKAARATLILIPLLGLHYIITPFRPEPGLPGEVFYEVTAAVVASLQGFCVSLLFCFFNGEVIGLLRKKWTQEILMRQTDRRTSYAATTISFSTRHSPSEDVRHLHQKLMSEV